MWRIKALTEACSPHTRGGSQWRYLPAKPPDLFPAHAGVILCIFAAARSGTTVPRTRGGDPEARRFLQLRDHCSPHTRG